MKRIVIFASGSGTNAEAIMRRFAERNDREVALVLSNKAGAGVFDRAARFGVKARLIDRSSFYENGGVLAELQALQPDLIVLAGFLWKVPDDLIRAFAGRIVNIHPSLLPKFGGKGMYGQHVHQAVIAQGEAESGITIHQVNEVYDDGEVLFQASCPVMPEDTPDSLAQRIHTLEHEHFPRVVDQLLDR